MSDYQHFIDEIDALNRQAQAQADRWRRGDFTPREAFDRSWPGAAGENWEGGLTDGQGYRWIHVPHAGWRLADRPPYLTPAPRLSWWARLRRWLP